MQILSSYEKWAVAAALVLVLSIPKTWGITPPPCMAKTALLRILRIKTQGPFNLGIPSKYPYIF